MEMAEWYAPMTGRYVEVPMVQVMIMALERDLSPEQGNRDGHRSHIP